MNTRSALSNFQKKAILTLGILFAIDNLITMYGVFFYGPGFYEANPMFNYFLERSPWLLLCAITYLKITALAYIVTVAHYCNRTAGDKWNNGEAWGSRACGLMTLWMGSALGIMTYMNFA